MNPFADRGYLIFPKVVPDSLCRAVVADILAHTEGDKSSASAYGMVEMYHYQSMWDVRQHPSLHTAFTGLFKTERLWVSIDRTSYKPVAKLSLFSPPEGHGAVVPPEDGFIHWDINVNQRLRPFAVQGVVALTDTDETMGGFQCVPDLYRGLDEWLLWKPTQKAIFSHFHVMGEEAVEVIPKGWPDRHNDRWKIEKVPMRAGDLLVYDSFLPHGNGPNRGQASRFAQYVTMTLPGDERLRQERIECWRTNAPPSDWAFPGDPRRIERSKPSAMLTPLGRKLLGLDEWETA